MDTAYHYEPIDTTTRVTRMIRLIGARNSDDLLCCEMVAINLRSEQELVEERTHYEAISYTWDGQDPSPAHFILVQSSNYTFEKLYITTNAHAALKRMRLESGYRNLWIDSVCIDQKSPKEKDFQMRNMGHIYTSADAVLAWLGEAVSPRTCLAITYLQRISSHKTEVSSSHEAPQGIFDDIRRDSVPQRSAMFQQVKRWSLMEDFFSHSWFTRVWTLQEISLNTSDPIFHYGDQTIKLSQIAHAMAIMFDHAFEHASVAQEALGHHLELRTKLQKWRACWTYYSIGSEPFFKFAEHDGPRFRLGDILRISRHMNASMPVDKVNAVHGICEWLDLYLPPPRYDRSIEDTFFEATCTAIEGYDDLSMLYETNGPVHNNRLPSWVPDWAQGWRRMYGAPMISTEDFSAGGAKALYQIAREKKLLKLKCKFVDEVARVSATVPVNEDTPIFASIQSGWSNYEGILEDSWAAWEVFRGWASLVQKSYSQSAVTIDDLFLTLLGDSIISVPSNCSSSEPLLDLEHAKAAFRRWYNVLLETNDEVATERTQCAKDLVNRIWFAKHILWSSDHNVRLVHFHVSIRTKGQCFFITKQGRMGLGIGTLAIGQRIAVVAGLKMPLILEAFGEQYRIIGHACVHGVMKGEAWPANSGALTVVSIE